jgi:TonB family protein
MKAMGDRLGRYRVLKHLASGGMADVLIGRTEGIEGFERHVVLKRIKPEHAKDPRFVTMFLDEARLAATLHHQSIVQVHDIGEANGEYFFAMEYIHGEDLRKLLSAVSKARTHMPLGLVCAIVSAAASGLHYAHERRDSNKKPLNIVHRDVSPSNILIGYDGAVKVVDFGIAKAAMRQVETRSGSLKGKVSYMSPEQCKGDEIDRRSDVYALGVLLYELATTSRLFKGDNDYLMMDAIVNGRVPLPRVKRPDLPNELSSIIMRAIAVDRNRRYQTAEELRTALDHFAVRNNHAASTASLATYLKKMFGGERPEPWLDASAGGPNVDVDAPTQAAGQSWTEMSQDAAGDGDPANPSQPTTATGSKRRPRRSGIANAVAVADTIAPPISPVDTRTSMKMGWEAQRFPAVVRNKLVWLGGPALVLVVLLIWKLAGSDDKQPAAAAKPTPAMPAAATPAVATPASASPSPAASTAAPEIPPVRVAGAEPAPAIPPVRVAGGEPAPFAAPTPPAAVDSAKRSPKKVPTKPGPAIITPTTSARPTAAPTPAPTSAPPAPPAPAVTTPAPTPVPAPPSGPVEPPMATLSNATVYAIASEHSKQLSQCEGGEDLHGDVAVSFQIDGTGKVVKAQLSSSIKNPKVAACVLKAVQSWKFPKPPSGSAKGAYSISYQ